MIVEPVAIVETVKGPAVQWSKVKFFRPEEFGEHSEQIDPRLVYALDELRLQTGKRIIITRSHDPRANKTSQHRGFGAVDIAFPGTPPWKGFDLLVTALRIEAFKGFGLYSDWRFEGEPCAGLHLDLRVSPGRVMWLGRRESAGGNNAYKPLTFLNLFEFFPEVL